VLPGPAARHEGGHGDDLRSGGGGAAAALAPELLETAQVLLGLGEPRDASLRALREWIPDFRTTVVDPQPHLAGGYKTGLAEEREVAGSGRLRKVQDVTEIPDAQLSRPAEQVQHPQAYRMPQELEPLRDSIHIVARSYRGPT
jgi:hypothetical protein